MSSLCQLLLRFLSPKVMYSFEFCYPEIYLAFFVIASSIETKLLGEGEKAITRSILINVDDNCRKHWMSLAMLVTTNLAKNLAQPTTISRIIQMKLGERC